MSQDYNATINLPKTDFPMRAGLPKREPEMLQRWKKLDVYGELLKKNADKPRFSLHDGPPFSNGNLHMGHALNKSIKDIIVRSHAMRGYCTPYIPGWDNHGMPIESAIIKQNKLNRKKMPVTEFRSACHEFAQHYVDVQSEGFQRLGALGDWAHPYLTMNPSFEAEEVKVFGRMYQRGYIYKGLKPVYWCPHDETALAEAEIEYQDDPCTTVYVKFPMHDDLGKLGEFDKSKLFFVIWTTTIWTLPGNLAIALHPDESYALVKAPNGEVYILAEALVKKVMEVGKIEGYEIVATHPGSFFENMLADHPFLPKTSRLVLADYVTMDSGTGCVHTAPGFGADDYETCKRYGMDMVVPVDDQGRHTDYAGKYAGLKTEESNPIILADMKESGALFASEEIVHSYPHCWRCKKPIIFRATPQWFCSVETFKDAACEACEEVRWVPAWGLERMKAMVRERADWCISRQRRWGLPIPVFYCSDCGKPIVTDETIQLISDLFGAEGSNAWFAKEAADILPAGFTCPHCGKAGGFTKEEDTLDGWFDSGSSHFASMQKDQGFWPADVYMEGLDQYRGWFQAALLTAVGSTGVAKAPFKTCITHGWTVDGEGKAMHKSLGNAVSPDEVIREYGADMLRLWVASADYTQDMRISKDIMKQLSQAYLKIRNTARYMLGNLCDFDPDTHAVAYDKLEELDRFALASYNNLVKACREAYDRYEFHGVYRAVYNFCVVDMSNFYLDIIKDRLYCGDDAGRRSAQTALYTILDGMTRLIAPILAFTSDEIWHAMKHAKGVDAESVLLNDIPGYEEKLALDAAGQERWDKLVSLRDAVNKALENARNAGVFKKAQDTDITLSVSAADAAFLEGVDLATLCIVSKVTVTTGQVEGEQMEDCLVPCTIAVKLSEAPKCPRCWNHNEHIGTEGHHPELCPRCAAVVGE